uniref:Uncharacterized protein n=1 Tax=Aegilops tauschii subsp. strangulata TaxID=200361 RepID=A0A453CLL6_AEGTS
ILSPPTMISAVRSTQRSPEAKRGPSKAAPGPPVDPPLSFGSPPRILRNPPFPGSFLGELLLPLLQIRWFCFVSRMKMSIFSGKEMVVRRLICGWWGRDPSSLDPRHYGIDCCPWLVCPPVSRGW